MKLIEQLDKRSWILPGGAKKTGTFGIFECPICKKHVETSISKGNNKKTCGKNECQQTYRKISKDSPDNINPKQSSHYRTFQRIYQGMKTRCYNEKDKSYKYYGAKGIKICDRWINFDNFIIDMFPKYKELKELSSELKTSPSIDRINNDKDYSLENCEWIAYGENSAKDKRIPIVRMDFDENIIETYSSMTEAAKKYPYTQCGAMKLYTSVSQIHYCCNEKSKHHVGYKWAFATNKQKMQ